METRARSSCSCRSSHLKSSFQRTVREWVPVWVRQRHRHRHRRRWRWRWRRGDTLLLPFPPQQLRLGELPCGPRRQRGLCAESAGYDTRLHLCLRLCVAGVRSALCEQEQ